MIASWPTDLPRPERDGFGLERGDGLLRSRNDAGPRRIRRRVTNAPRYLQARFIFTRAQLASFDRFFDEDIAQGALPFLMPDPATDGWALLTDEGEPLLTDDDIPILLAETWLCQIGDRMPAVSIQGMQFVVSIELLVLP